VESDDFYLCLCDVTQPCMENLYKFISGSLIREKILDERKLSDKKF